LPDRDGASGCARKSNDRPQTRLPSISWRHTSERFGAARFGQKPSALRDILFPDIHKARTHHRPLTARRVSSRPSKHHNDVATGLQDLDRVNGVGHFDDVKP
jgi:hypothetical protein